MKTNKFIAVIFATGIISLSFSSLLALSSGDTVQCNSSSGAKVRSTAVYDTTNGNVIGTVANGISGIVGNKGSAINGGYTWYWISWSSGISGWTADASYVKTSGGLVKPGSFTISNEAPVWDTATPPGPAVRLNWTTSSGATTYSVYRNGSSISSGITGTTFRNETGLTSGQSYSYYIVATNSAGTTQSNTITVGPMPSAPASKPGSFTISNEAPVWDTANPPGPAVRLNWTSSSGATSYAVYRNGSSISSGITGTTFRNETGLTSGQSYSYYIVATNSAGTTQSNTITVGPMPGAPASKPGNFTISNEAPVWDTSAPPGPAVRLNWTSSSGATSYAVYRNGSSISSGITGTTFRNETGLTSGQSYSYYIVATNSAGTTQSNTITVGPMPSAPASVQDSYEPDDSSGTAKTITNGETQNRNIHVAGNQDWAKFTVVNGATNLRIETNGGSGDTQLYLYGPNSATTQVVGGYNDDDGNGNFSLLVAGTRNLPATLPAGTYYIKVQEYNNDGTIPSYTLLASWTDTGGGTGINADSYEADDSATAAKAITNGQTQTRNIHAAGNQDWAKFTVVNGATNLRIETNGSSGDTQLYLYGPNSTTTQVVGGYNDDDGNGNFSLLVAGTRSLPTTLAPGTYYIKVQEYNNDGTIPAYTLQASWTDTGGGSGITADSYEADDSATAAKDITNGQTQNRNIHAAGNLDWAKFTVVNGASNLRIETNGGSGDTQLYLYGPNNATTQVTGGYNDDDGNGNFSLLVAGTRNLPATLPAGTYYIKVQEYNNDGTIPAYTLQASWTDTGGGSGITADSYEADDGATAAKAITNGQTQSRNIHAAGNQDWAKFTVANGASNLRIETNGGSGDTQLYLYGPNSTTTQVTGGYNDDDGNGSFSLLVAGQLGLPTTLAPGTYYIKVQESNNDGTIPAYTLQASWTDQAAPGNQLITQTQCIAILGHTIPDSVLNDLNACLVRFSINTPVRMRHFIAQCAHESKGFTDFIEDASGWAYDPSINPTKAKNLGNIQVGDGPKYKGAGAIQLTGRYNYQSFANHIHDQLVMQGVDFVASTYPLTSAGYFWVYGKDVSLNTYVDSGATCEQVSIKVNGINSATGRPNGIEERLQFYYKCELAIPSP